jgi:hypothetical protein
MIMNSHKQLLMALALISFFSVGACRKTSAPNEPTAASPADIAERQHPESGAVPAVENKFFKGSIGSALDLQMKLAREGEKLTGSYFYQKVGTKIDLRGNVDKDGNLTLEEFDAGGKQTGVFKGLWKDEGGAIGIAGNWTKPGSDKKTAFSLHEQPIEFSNGVEIVSRQIREKNKKLKYEIDAQYPQLSGSVDPNFEKFNQTVRSLITKKVNDFKKEMAPSAEDEPAPDSGNLATEESQGSDITIGYEVALAKDDLISIEFAIGSYFAGAVHPNSYTEVVNFDLKNGKLLKLGELFLPASKYVQTISKFSIQELKKQSKEQGADAMLDDDWIQKGAGPDVTNYDKWAITKQGLEITFDPYQVGPYAAGSQRIVVPYSALKDIIKPDGALGPFVK